MIWKDNGVDMKGQIIDVQLGDDGQSMDVWMYSCHRMHRVVVPWRACIHVHSEKSRLAKLADWLQFQEIREAFSVGRLRKIRARLSLDAFEQHDVLEIEFTDSRKIRRLAQHIEAKGEYHHYTLYSVDAHLAQRFFIEHGIAPFQSVVWDGSRFISEKGPTEWPNLRVMELRFSYQSPKGFEDMSSELCWLEYRCKDVMESANNHAWQRIDYDIGPAKFLHTLHACIEHFDPDIILTKGGDRQHLTYLQQLSDLHYPDFNLHRKTAKIKVRSNQRVVHSYGQVIRKENYVPLHGRLHIDLKSSFIVKEGGLLGLFELAHHSRQSTQDISRLSPGSVISAIQMRVAMEDGVLVPWKKNRPEDTKTAWELMMSDRGGLYLDSQPGVYTNVIELDFASLFPSIIATRNISPETLNCSCCQVYKQSDKTPFVPLNPDDANLYFRKKKRNQSFSLGVFPQADEAAQMVPGLALHTCGRTHGFLGRVVAPIIERRTQLKQKRQSKGDMFDQQQNALKWLLVTCFGYTGYKNARFGRIEAHEAICAWAREILLQTIAMAEEDGWQVRHAIVDCVWIDNPSITDTDVKRDLAKVFAKKVSDKIGIPLEYEAMYDFIGFLPSRMHGAGSLTKYWAHGEGELKLRGIEARQHSTCDWISSLQSRAFELLVEAKKQHLPLHDLKIQQRIISMLHASLKRLERHEIEPLTLIISRRVTKTLEQFSVFTLTYASVLRAQQLGHTINPGEKARFLVVVGSKQHPHTRVILEQELHDSSIRFRVDVRYYRRLALRAIWAILAPFGWSEEEISSGRRIVTLDQFIQPHPRMVENHQN